MKLSKKFSKKIKSKAAVLLCAITAICAILATDKVINKQNSIFQYIANSISTTSTSGSETSATDSNIIKSGYNICVSTTGSDETGDGTKEKPYFEILYHEIGKEYDNIGFGSYNLNNVFIYSCLMILNFDSNGKIVILRGSLGSSLLFFVKGLHQQT